MKKKLLPIYGATFFFTIHYAITLYVNSSFISNTFGESAVGFLFSTASFLSLIGLSAVPALLRNFGQFATTILLMLLAMTATAGLAISESKVIIIVGFLMFTVLDVVLRCDFDIYLEKFSKNAETGWLRAIYLTIINTAILAGPFIAGYLISGDDFRSVYIVATLIMVPALYIVLLKLRHLKDIKYDRASIWESLPALARDKNLFHIFMVSFLLEFFYSWMVIYTPIHLTQNIGFAWSDIGIIFPIMLLPFVLFEIPLGRIADHTLGEKEILVSGFVIIAFFTGIISFLSTPAFWIWALVLFLTRVGASAVEIMSESYFFKHVSAKDTNAVSLFRDARPLASLFGPLLGSLVIAIAGFQVFYLILGALMLLGIPHALAIKDTK